MDILCAGPGPHEPTSGVLGESDRDVPGMYCPLCAQAVLEPVQEAGRIARASLATAQGGIDSLLAQQSALASQIAADASMFAATPVGSTLTSEHIAALTRMVNGFGTVMQAITAHLMLTGNAPPTTPLS